MSRDLARLEGTEEAGETGDGTERVEISETEPLHPRESWGEEAYRYTPLQGNESPWKVAQKLNTGAEKEKRDEEGSRYRRLWIKVIQQAQAEARGDQLYGVLKADFTAAILRARDWLMNGGEDFRAVCSLGGVGTEEAEKLERKMRKLYLD